MSATSPKSHEALESAKKMFRIAISELEQSFEHAQLVKSVENDELMARCISSAFFIRQALSALGMPRTGKLFITTSIKGSLHDL